MLFRQIRKVVFLKTKRTKISHLENKIVLILLGAMRVCKRDGACRYLANLVAEISQTPGRFWLKVLAENHWHLGIVACSEGGSVEVNGVASACHCESGSAFSVSLRQHYTPACQPF